MIFDDFPPFPGLSDAGMQFLRDLKLNNDREWFKPRKEIFDDEVMLPTRCLVADVTRRATSEGLTLSGGPKGAIFRIYRDTRFSKNKQPYKTHVGVFWSRSGSRKEWGGLYVHFEPGKSFVALGHWRVEPPMLRRWRERMSMNPGEWLEIVEGIESRGVSVTAEEPLKRMPQGFQDFQDHDIAPWLKAKGFTAAQKLTDAQVQSPKLTEDVIDFARRAIPLLEYGWEIEDHS